MSCYESKFSNKVFFFFFQAEDGIRDYKVTGVQTCALPICPSIRSRLELLPARGDGEARPHGRIQLHPQGTRRGSTRRRGRSRTLGELAEFARTGFGLTRPVRPRSRAHARVRDAAGPPPRRADRPPGRGFPSRAAEP